MSETSEKAPVKWVKGMKSPNPAGRPKGSLSNRDKVARALNDDGEAVARVVIESAMNGDMQAAGIVPSRILPPVRSQTERVSFAFDAELPIGKQVEQVLAAVAAGEVAPDVGQTIVAMITNLASVRATENLEDRILALEAREVR